MGDLSALGCGPGPGAEWSPARGYVICILTDQSSSRRPSAAAPSRDTTASTDANPGVKPGDS